MLLRLLREHLVPYRSWLLAVVAFVILSIPFYASTPFVYVTQFFQGIAYDLYLFGVGFISG